jgi:uncharacterized protein YbjT (DUF2867 family)
MLFVMGATGRMGGAVLRHATGPVRAGTRSGSPVSGATETVRFDLDDSQSFADAIEGCTAIFVMRPPSTITRAPFERLMTAARDAGARHVVCASVYGAGTSRVLPHRHMEAAVRDSGLSHTFLRPADFMQNVVDVHGASIREDGVIAVPAGQGSSAFLDAEDIGRACAGVLAAPAGHDGRGYDLTGPEALTFREVAEVMTQVLGRSVRYCPTTVLGFVLREVQRGRPASMALVMAALYTAQRINRAAPVRPDFESLTGRAPSSFANYLARVRTSFVRSKTLSTP